jgi:hypothetical protein
VVRHMHVELSAAATPLNWKRPRTLYEDDDDDDDDSTNNDNNNNNNKQ